MHRLDQYWPVGHSSPSPALEGFRVQKNKPGKAGQFAGQIVHASAPTTWPIKSVTFS
jgi:hypothetical protein